MPCRVISGRGTVSKVLSMVRFIRLQSPWTLSRSDSPVTTDAMFTETTEFCRHCWRDYRKTLHMIYTQAFVGRVMLALTEGKTSFEFNNCLRNTLGWHH